MGVPLTTTVENRPRAGWPSRSSPAEIGRSATEGGADAAVTARLDALFSRSHPVYRLEIDSPSGQRLAMAVSVPSPFRMSTEQRRESAPALERTLRAALSSPQKRVSASFDRALVRCVWGRGRPE